MKETFKHPFSRLFSHINNAINELTNEFNFIKAKQCRVVCPYSPGTQFRHLMILRCKNFKGWLKWKTYTGK